MRHVPRMIASFPCHTSADQLELSIGINFYFNSSKFLMIPVSASASGEPNGANVSRASVRDINTTSRPCRSACAYYNFAIKINSGIYRRSVCRLPVKRTHVKHTKNIERIKIHRITLNNCVAFAVCERAAVRSKSPNGVATKTNTREQQRLTMRCTQSGNAKNVVDARCESRRARVARRNGKLNGHCAHRHLGHSYGVRNVKYSARITLSDINSYCSHSMQPNEFIHNSNTNNNPLVVGASHTISIADSANNSE